MENKFEEYLNVKMKVGTQHFWVAEELGFKHGHYLYLNIFEMIIQIIYYRIWLQVAFKYSVG